MTEEIKEILDNQKLINVENDYERIIFEYLANNCSEFDDEHIKQLVNLKVEQYKQLLERITNLQQGLDKANDIIKKDRQFYKCRMDEYAELKKENERLTESLEKQRHFYLCKISKIQQENERLKQLNENASKVCVAEHKYGVEKAEEARDYKSRCEKANTYINEEIKKIQEHQYSTGVRRLKKIQNILNRSDEK